MGDDQLWVDERLDLADAKVGLPPIEDVLDSVRLGQLVSPVLGSFREVAV